MQESGRSIEPPSVARARPQAAILGLALVLAVLSSCALRQRVADYQVVRYGDAHYIYPPGPQASNAGPPLEASFELAPTAPKGAARGCAVAEDGLDVRNEGEPRRRLVASLRLPAAREGDYEPSPEDSLSPKLRLAFEKLAEADCLWPRDVRPTIRQVLENLPLPFDELLPYHYSYFRGGSSIDLSSGTRLKVQEAIFDDAPRGSAESGGSPTPPDASKTPGRPPNPLEGYRGTITSYYDATEGQEGNVSLRLASVKSDVPNDADPHTTSGGNPTGLASLDARYLRLLFLGLLVREDTERKAVLLAAEGSEELERMSRAVLENPVGLCEAAAAGAAAQCFEFSGRISTEVEIRVRVEGEYRYVLLGTPLKAVAPPEAGVDNAVFAKLKLHRRYNGRLVSVRFPREDKDSLLLPLLAGDEIDW